MPAASAGSVKALQRIDDFDSLVAYLRDELEWEIPDVPPAKLTYSYTANELGLKLDTQVEIKQLRPILGQKDPWGVFFIDFDRSELPITLLRRLLSGVSRKQRESANASNRALFNKNDLLFVSAYGKAEDRRLALAHFHQEPEMAALPTLRVIDWGRDETVRHIARTAEQLDRLRWIQPGELPEAARQRWASAFVDRPREAIRTSKEMATALAEAARTIRRGIEEVLPKENPGEPLPQLFEAVKATLNKELDVLKFADTYAQTLSYGLLAKRMDQVQRWRADKAGALNGTLPLPPITIDALEMALPTNPFLSELLSSFLTAVGRDGSARLDFDVLGIGDLVELLNTANIDAVLADFDKTGDDPVIHFYEGFLAAYDKAMKAQRGVFYTPKPLVGFIVRSVDEVLRTEFGLANGLADTTSWGEFVVSHPEAKIPDGVGADEPFVKILDPATGTGTFLVEVIELIYDRLWNGVWKAKPAAEKRRLWNAWVPQHLLPRLYGYELMMAPYAVAHMKIGLKLADTGYDFSGLDADGSPARARVFLTNALEPAQELDAQLSFMNEALAHEAKAANEAKAKTQFTVLVGNPPYSNMSANLTPTALAYVERYRFVDKVRIRERNMLQFERNINDDYVKFFGLTSSFLSLAGIGCVGIVTNNVFTWSPSLRGLRKDILDRFSVAVLDLHGASQRGAASIAAQGDENVFEIEQSVAITRIVYAPMRSQPLYAEIVGPERMKLKRLSSESFSNFDWKASSARNDQWRLKPEVSPHAAEYELGESIEDIFHLFSEAVKTGRDWLVVDFEKHLIHERMTSIHESRESNEELIKRIGLSVKKSWNLTNARLALKLANIYDFISVYAYRVFDNRFVFYHPAWIASSAAPVMQSVSVSNLILLSGRTSRNGQSVLTFCTNRLVDKGLLSTLDNVAAFPLWNAPSATDARFSSNLRAPYIDGLEAALSLEAEMSQTEDPEARCNFKTSFGVRDVFDWIYAVLHSLEYRKRYADLLASDYPRVPLPKDRPLFVELVPIGTRLVALHLLDPNAAPELAEPKVKFSLGKGEPPQLGAWGDKKDVRRDQVSGRVYINADSWFATVPQQAWEHWIGGYQPAQKWLKDRAQTGSGVKLKPGRVLTDDDILHYRRMIVALTETAKLQAEIDKVIARHGGWPGAFKGMTD